MAKINEKEYFKKIGDQGVDFSLNKPYSDLINVGGLLHNIASVASIIKNHFGANYINLLDVGCGSGWTSNQFAMMGHKTTGVDISPEAIKAAKTRFDRANLDFYNLDYDQLAKNFNEEFDAVIFIDSLHHSDSTEKTLRSVFKTLKKGGICIVCEPGRGHSKAPDAIEAVNKYGVTEKDLPPAHALKSARNIGFQRHKIYASPSLMHRSLYWEYPNSKIKGILKYDIFRFLSLNYLFIAKRHREGLLVFYK